MCEGSQFDGCSPNWALRWNVNDNFFIRKAQPNHVYGRYQIGISTENNELIAQVAIGVVDHEHGDIYVGALFLRH
jgi:hypothetical protein